MAIKKESRETRKKRKIWYTIIAPKEFNKQVLGETPAIDPKSLINRPIVLNLTTLTRDLKQQNVKITFSIKEIKENQALTEVIAYNLVSAFVKRITKIAKNKIDHSFIAKTKDNIKVRIKPLIITKTKTKRSILTSLRKKSEDFLKERLQKQTYEDFLVSLTSYKIQKELKNLLKKTYPIRTSEIRSLKKL